MINHTANKGLPRKRLQYEASILNLQPKLIPLPMTDTSCTVMISISKNPHQPFPHDLLQIAKEDLRGVLLLPGNDLLDTNSSLNSNNHTVITASPGFTDGVGHIIRVSGKVKIGLLDTTFVHKSELFTFDINDLPVIAVDNRDSGTVRRGNHIFELLSSENINGKKVTLGVSVLSGLGDRDGEDLAGLSLDHHKSVTQQKAPSLDKKSALKKIHGREHRVRIKSTTEYAQDSTTTPSPMQKKHSPSLLDLTSFHGDGGGGTGIGDLKYKIIIVRHLASKSLEI
jgi:hypothetical protein